MLTPGSPVECGRKAGVGRRRYQRTDIGLIGIEFHRRRLADEVDLGFGDTGHLAQRALHSNRA